MQPTLICTARVPGMICLNGRFAGEASEARPLIAPVSPGGAVYLEYRPLAGSGQSLARKVVLSGGAPLAESLEGASGISCVAWPGGALEVEFTCAETTVEPILIDGMPGTIRRGEDTALTLNGLSIPVPEGALPPRLIRQGGAVLLLGGAAGGGQYLAALSADMAALLGTLEAEAIEPEDGGLFSAVIDLGDHVGHGRLEQWLAEPSGLRRVSAESVWSHGAPRWPDTAEGAMIAAVEAALAGLGGECAGYLSPALASEAPLSSVAGVCDMCVPMKYGVPDARPCVGLLKAENAHLATVRPLFYRAEPVAGSQGPWQIGAVSLE